jgi:Zn-dependent M16 (insulinase) family peptidase
MGTADHDYAEIANRIDLHTGGIGLSPNARTGFSKTGEGMTYLTLSAKCLNRNHAPMSELIHELVHRCAFSDLDRLNRLLLEYQADMESMIVQNGHRLAISLASRNFSKAGRLNELWFGVHQLAHVKKITRDLNDAGLRKIAEALHELAGILFRRDNLKIALIGENSMFENARTEIDQLLDKMSINESRLSLPAVSPAGTAPVRESWRTSTAVSFVASAAKTVRMEHPDAPVLAVIAKLIRSLFIHREIREKGGAYGGFAIYSAEDGLFSLASYRDPHIVNTLRVFDRVPEFMRSGVFADDDIKEAILQVCAEIDRPNTPAAAARKAFHRRIVALSDEARLLFKTQVLATNRDRIRDVAARRFGGGESETGVAVISGDQQIRQANEQLGEKPLSVFDI